MTFDALDLSVLDFALTAYLVLFLPALRLWKGSDKKPSAQTSRSPPYARNIARMVILISVLAVDWWWSGRSIAALGLEIPIPRRGEICLGIAAVLVLALMIASWFSMKQLRGEKLIAAQTKIDSLDLFPRKSSDWLGFLISVVLLGTGWEILYRGYLLWALTPLIGTFGAVSVAALAYGLGHGYKNRGQQIGNVASAFGFTIAYAATHSLWWLIVVHVALPLSAALGYWAMRPSPFLAANPEPVERIPTGRDADTNG